MVTRLQRTRKYSTNPTTASLVRHSQRAIRCETQDFSETKRQKKKIMEGWLCAQEITRGFQTCRISRTPLCSPIGRIVRNFSLYILLSGYLKLSILLYYSHHLRKDDSSSLENDTQILHCVKSARGVLIM